ncbi:hypothetical protein RSAG8_13669, partial [Rhizoctonia solani AG-8 WAC10335]
MNGTAIITGASSGLARVRVGSMSVWVADKAWLAPQIWAPRMGMDGNGQYDLGPRTGSVLVFGPYLVRNATIIGSTLALTGDLKPEMTHLQAVIPPPIKSITFNHHPVQVSISPTGTLQGSITVQDPTPKLPSLRDLEWKYADSLPEVGEFDDLGWVLADKMVTAWPSRFQPLSGKWVLFLAEYGFHHVFLNRQFLGSAEGRGTKDLEGGLDMVNVTYPFEGLDENVLTVVVDNMGLEQDWNSKDEFKAPRGIRGYELLGGGDFMSWRIAGASNGDTIRGPMNLGGLYVERTGAVYSNDSAVSWSAGSPFVGIDKAGIRAYKTTLRLDVPEDADVPFGFKFVTGGRCRVMLYVNGWQFGKFVSSFGPQSLFPVPEGVLNHRGENEVVMILWALDPEGGKVDVELVATNGVVSSKEVVRGLVA